MGLLSGLRVAVAARQLTADTVVLPPVRGDVAQVANLPATVAQAFGVNTDLSVDVVTRKEAMTIPTVRQGRSIIAGAIGSVRLTATRSRAGNAPEQVVRSILTQPDPYLPLTGTLTWTVDDLLFYGFAVWLVTARGADGFPSSASRIDPGRVSIDQGRMRIDGDLVRDEDVVVFRGPDEGLLRSSARALRTSLMLEEAVRRYARMDVPLGYFQDPDGTGTIDDEIQQFLDDWEAARVKRSTGYVPGGLEYKTPGFNPQQLQLGEARGIQAAEMARAMNLPPSYVNAPSNDSLTYTTTESNRRQLVDLTLAPFVVAIEQRLSMGDVTPLGTTVRLDFGAFTRGDTSQVVTTGAAAVAAGLMTVDEVRVQWLGLPPMPDTTPPTPTSGATP